MKALKLSSLPAADRQQERFELLGQNEQSWMNKENQLVH